MPLDQKIADRAPNAETAALFERLDGLDVQSKFFRALDATHLAHFVKGDRTLVVTFELTERILGVADAQHAMPVGQTLYDAFGWSVLTVLATERSWFRSAKVHALFDELIDKEFFDAFERVVFYGIGPAGYAACAYSVAAPGATVIAIAPHATQDPRYARFDTRFPEARRQDFTSRFGYAPHMIEGAEAVHLFYDPGDAIDAAHAAQFNQRQVHHHPARFYGPHLEYLLENEEMTEGLFSLYNSGTLNDLEIARLMRNRQNRGVYLRHLLGLTQNRPFLAALICHGVTQRTNAPAFRRRLEQLRQHFEGQGITLPFDRGTAEEQPAPAAQD